MKTISFMPELSSEQREKELKKICKTKRQDKFKRSLTDAEIEKELRNYADLGIKLEEKENEKLEVMKTHNEAIKAVEAEQHVSLDIIKNGKKEVLDNLYDVPNYETGQMETFDSFGELIETRRLTPDEHTGHLFNNDGSETESNEPEKTGPKEIGFDGAENKENSDIQDADFEEINETDKENETDPEIVDGDAPEKDDELETEKKPKKPRKGKNDADVSE